VEAGESEDSKKIGGGNHKTWRRGEERGPNTAPHHRKGKDWDKPYEEEGRKEGKKERRTGMKNRERKLRKTN
jgi:hypothetical protein